MPEPAGKPPRQSSQAPKISRNAHIRWVPIADMRISERAQREYREPHAREYADNFDLEGFGYPVVNHRDGHWYIIDGVHRVAALKMMGWEDQQIECEAYEGLTEEQEAELFLKRNRRRTVVAFDIFRIAVVAGREQESEIDRVVRTQGLKVSLDDTTGSIGAVTALNRIYSLGGSQVLGRALRILRDAYAADRNALRGDILTGMGLVCNRYNGKLDEAQAIKKLATVSGGALGILGKAQIAKRLTGKPISACIAATMVEEINSGTRNGVRLEHWWK